MSDSFKQLSSQFTGLALSFGVTGNGVSIDPATGAVRIPTDALQDGLDVTVTASDSGGAAVGSFRLTVRADAPAATAPVLVAPPSLAGSGAIGSPLTVDPGRWDGRPAPELTLQWRRDGADIAGAVAAELPAGGGRRPGRARLPRHRPQRRGRARGGGRAAAGGMAGAGGHRGRSATSCSKRGRGRAPSTPPPPSPARRVASRSAGRGRASIP